MDKNFLQLLGELQRLKQKSLISLKGVYEVIKDLNKEDYKKISKGLISVSIAKSLYLHDDIFKKTLKELILEIEDEISNITNFFANFNDKEDDLKEYYRTLLSFQKSQQVKYTYLSQIVGEKILPHSFENLSVEKINNFKMKKNKLK